MTITTKLAPPLRVDCPRDRFKRPILIDPNDPIQKAVTYQRVTTLAGMIDDTYALTNWKMRQVAKGVAWRDDIRIAVATTKDDDSDGKRELDALCERAMDAAGGNAGSAMGTAFHRVCQIAQAYPDVDPASYCPPELRNELLAYSQLITEHGLYMPVDYQERTGICPEVGVAGTWDDLATGGPSCGCGRFHVVDKKSGQREFEYGQGKVSAQLAIYARFTSLWLAVGGGYEAPPRICDEVAYVISVPIGRPDDACIYPVDLVAGWDRALLAVQVREKRNQKRGLFGEALTLPGASVEIAGQVYTVANDAVTSIEPAKPKRTRRTKAQIAADAAEAERVAREKAHLDRITDQDIEDARPPAPLDLPGGTVWPTSGETGTAFLMNGELKPGPADHAHDALAEAVADVEQKTAEVVALLGDKLGAEVVPATVERVRPDAAQLDRERAAAYAGLHNGTTAQAELAKVADVAVDEAQALRTAIEIAKDATDLETAYTLWSSHWGPEHDHMAVRRLISLTGTREGLDRIWETYQSVWTDDLTAAGNARLAELARL